MRFEQEVGSLRTAFFSPRSTRQADPRPNVAARPQDPDRPVLEQQQALLMEVLGRAGGTPVSYTELNDAGVEFPASVVSELELAGVAIERCFARGTGSRRMLGVRLVPPADPHRPGSVGATTANRPIPDSPSQGNWGAVRVYRTPRGRLLVEAALAGVLGVGAAGRKWARRATAGRPAVGIRMFAPLAVLVAAGVAVAVVVSGQPGGGGPGPRAERARYHPPTIAHPQVIARPAASIGARTVHGPRKRSTPARTTTTSTASTTSPHTSTPPIPAPPTPTPATQTQLSPVSPPASDLEARGHDLMVAGQYDQAVPVLRQALAATGERPGACSAPTTQACLTYAFALYDLGRSLRLAGRPAAAVPILRHRLQIDNQRPVVATELLRARQQAGQRTAEPSGRAPRRHRRHRRFTRPPHSRASANPARRAQTH